jgi:hypothetical protein
MSTTYLDENNNKINIKDLWKYKYISTSNDNSIVYMQSPNENHMRYLREQHCFSVINRGTLWYDTLTTEQKEELKVWYKSWLDVTATKIIPENPVWLK